MSAVPCLDALQSAAPPWLMQAVSDDIAAVEFLIGREIHSHLPTVENAARNIFTAGGKRLRPAIVSLAARATGNPFKSTRVHLIGAAMEMVHMATLIHDDVIDESHTRRGRPTANALYGNRIGVLAGDVLLSKAMRLLAMDDDLGLMRMVAEAVVAMSEGEVAEVESLGCLDLSPQRHLEIVRKKTAVFVEACCRAGARIGGADEAAEEMLGRYGHHVGMAFQLADDILDFRGDPEKIGKAVGGDFREGCPTLPVIHALVSAPDSDRDILRRQFGRDADNGRMNEVIGMIERSGGFERAHELAVAHVQSAMASLSPLPETPASACLARIADFVVSRDR
ncbi:MAG: polyprenyl synthetase family protein [Fimbriimonadia bacterium]